MKPAWLLVPALVLGCLVLTTAAPADPPPPLPTNCSSGDLLVASSGGRFECRNPDEALRLSGCSTGDFVTTDYGRLKCVSPSTTPWGAKALLPDCSSGSRLQSEGFGRWKCVSD